MLLSTPCVTGYPRCPRTHRPRPPPPPPRAARSRPRAPQCLPMVGQWQASTTRTGSRYGHYGDSLLFTGSQVLSGIATFDSNLVSMLLEEARLKSSNGKLSPPKKPCIGKTIARWVAGRLEGKKVSCGKFIFNQIGLFSIKKNQTDKIC